MFVFLPRNKLKLFYYMKIIIIGFRSTFSSFISFLTDFLTIDNCSVQFYNNLEEASKNSEILRATMLFIEESQISSNKIEFPLKIFSKDKHLSCYVNTALFNTLLKIKCFENTEVLKKIKLISENLSETVRNTKSESIKVKIQSLNHNLQFEDIIKIKASGCYSEIYVSKGKVHTTCKSLGFYSKTLPSSQFIRIHNSCIVNLEHIRNYYYNKNLSIEMSNGVEEFVSQRNTKNVMEIISKLNL